MVIGDMFIVDNCTIHMFGDNLVIHYALFNVHRVLMTTSPPYHPEYNPIELVFNTLLQRISSKRACYNSLDVDRFLDAIRK